MSKAEKILERMRNNKVGWEAKDFATLFTGFGFKREEGKKHTTYVYAKYPFIMNQIPRHRGDLPPQYARDSVELIDKLKEILAEEKRKEEEAKRKNEQSHT